MNSIWVLLSMIHKGNCLIKAKSLITLSFLLSPIAFVFDKLYEWHIDNQEYAGFVIGAIAIDHILGTLYHLFWLRDFSFKKNVRGLVLKLLIVVSVGYLFEGMDALMSEDSILKEYTIMVLRLMVFLYPAGSAFGNSYEMTGRKFPPVGFMNKLEEFSKTTTINKNEAA